MKRLKLFLIDAFANYIFFVPINTLIIWQGSRNPEAIWAYILGAIITTFLGGGVYGIFLNKLRDRFS